LKERWILYQSIILWPSWFLIWNRCKPVCHWTYHLLDILVLFLPFCDWKYGWFNNNLSFYFRLEILSSELFPLIFCVVPCLLIGLFMSVPLNVNNLLLYVISRVVGYWFIYLKIIGLARFLEIMCSHSTVFDEREYYLFEISFLKNWNGNFMW